MHRMVTLPRCGLVMSWSSETLRTKAMMGSFDGCILLEIAAVMMSQFPLGEGRAGIQCGTPGSSLEARGGTRDREKSLSAGAATGYAKCGSTLPLEKSSAVPCRTSTIRTGWKSSAPAPRSSRTTMLTSTAWKGKSSRTASLRGGGKARSRLLMALNSTGKHLSMNTPRCLWALVAVGRDRFWINSSSPSMRFSSRESLC
mmetsp:Transcript_67179/g.157565  ORF Transcript_67179/g.157565 Transcript_67179/m.157565 type:complete len:200 (-) Transcript_67179:17-616(-)